MYWELLDIFSKKIQKTNLKKYLFMVPKKRIYPVKVHTMHYQSLIYYLSPYLFDLIICDLFLLLNLKR